MIIKNKFGYCKFAFEKDFVHIYDLYIYPKYRYKGRGRKILKATINEIRKTYHGTIQIVANPKEKSVSKDKLIKFYESMNLKVFDYYG